MSTVAASIDATAFNCPHCGALAKQQWYTAWAQAMKKDATPLVAGPTTIDQFNFPDDEEQAEKILEFLKKLTKGKPFFDVGSTHNNTFLANIGIAQCFNCDELSIWLSDKMIWPAILSVAIPNSDLPADVQIDFNEAGAIAQQSPRGAAALLRLCIQKLCRHLGQPGQNLNSDIAAMTKGGLDPRIKKSLDVVRVIGNSAVHPGQLDLRDDQATVGNLFRLVNLIAEVMITYPKHVDELYEALPESTLQAIEKRDQTG